MARKRYAAEDIIGHLRTIEIETGKGLAVADGLPESRRLVTIINPVLKSVEPRVVASP